MTDRLDRLDDMAEKAASAWPSLPQWVIDAAVGHVVDNDVKHLGDLPKSGIDEWDVAGVRCSHRGRQCGCHRPGKGTVTKLGKICQHRLAVMFQMRLDESIVARLLEAYKMATENGIDKVALLADVYYRSGPAGRDRWLLKGWRFPGGSAKLAHGERMELTEERLGQILRAAGWMMVKKQQQGGYTYHAYTVPADSWHAKQQPEVDSGAGRIHGWSPYAKEVTEQRRKFASILDRVEEVAA